MPGTTCRTSESLKYGQTIVERTTDTLTDELDSYYIPIWPYEVWASSLLPGHEATCSYSVPPAFSTSIDLISR